MVFLLVSGSMLPNIPVSEREALITLYNATDGDNWEKNDNWKSGGVFSPPETENTWYGVTCDAANTMVVEIDINSNNLNGTIPPEMENFSNLEYLFLGHNLISGTIPPELGNLSNLKYLYLWGNQLSGEIPPELGNLSSLEKMWLCSNQLTGPIPPELGQLNNAHTI